MEPAGETQATAMVLECKPFATGAGEMAHEHFTRELRERLQALGGGRVCDLGGGANPAVELEFLERHGLSCLLVDISSSELDKAPAGYAKLLADVSSPEFAAGEHAGRYDVVFSRVLAEHVRDGRQFHRNVHAMLRPGGIAMHFFPTLWWPPFVVNRVLPESLAERVLLRTQPWRERTGKLGKFPAYYHWCYGPTRRQIGRFASVGFSVERCVAYFGEPTHMPGRLLGKLNDTWTSAMLRHPSFLFTTYAGYTLRAV